MTARRNSLFYGALAFSAAAHLLLILLLPGPPPIAPLAGSQYFPVTLVRPPPAVTAMPPEQAQRPAASRVKPSAAAPPVEPERAGLVVPLPPPTEETQVPALATAPVEVPSDLQPATPPLAASAHREPLSVTAPGQRTEGAGRDEAAAVARILSDLRAAITAEMRYPPLARARGWQGTAVIVARLDAAGGLQEAIIRRSSGYEVLDRAALALIRKVLPVANPLGRAVSIEIPIVYQLR